MKRVIIFASILCLICGSKLSAYEGPLHYLWTYYLALNAGFSERQAYQIASATFSIDWDESTGPLSFGTTKPDLFYGAERARFYHPVINPLWVELQKHAKKTGPGPQDDATTSDLARLERADTSILSNQWSRYYNAATEIAPALRIWLRFHAFAPLNFMDYRTNNPFPGKSLERDAWINKYQMNRGPREREEMWEDLDEQVVQIYKSLWLACNDKAMSACLTSVCKSADVSCPPEPYDLRDLYRVFRGRLLQPRAPRQIVTPTDQLLAPLIYVLPRIWRIEEELGMSWVEVERKMSEAWTRLVKELRTESDGRPLPPSNAHGSFVTAVRAESVTTLWDLARRERNPGPLLHYIQDLQPHGDYDTLHGHGLNAHRPDFIATNPDFAWRATEDSATILCRFRNDIGINSPDFDIDPLRATVSLPGVTETQVTFIWQPRDESTVCNSEPGSTPEFDPVRLALLRKDLEAMAVTNPTPTTRGLVTNGLQAMTGLPLYLRNDYWLALPSLTRAMSVLRNRLRTGFYASDGRRVRDVKTFWPNLQAGPSNPDRLEQVFDRRSDVPYRLIAYDFDVCGRVADNDRATESDDQPGDGLCAGSEAEQDAEREEAIKHDVSEQVKQTTADAYEVERIRVSIGELSVMQTLPSSDGYARIHITLHYEVTGLKPGLDGENKIRTLEVTKKGFTDPLGFGSLIGQDRDTRMKAVTGGAPVELGTAQIPILEHCSPVFEEDTDGVDIPTRWSDLEYSGEVEQFGEALLEDLKEKVHDGIQSSVKEGFKRNAGRVFTKKKTLNGPLSFSSTTSRRKHSKSGESR